MNENSQLVSAIEASLGTFHGVHDRPPPLQLPVMGAVFTGIHIPCTIGALDERHDALADSTGTHTQLGHAHSEGMFISFPHSPRSRGRASKLSGSRSHGQVIAIGAMQHGAVSG